MQQFIAEKLFRNRYGILFAFILFFLLLSFGVRSAFLILAASKTTFTFTSILGIFARGFIYDLGVALFFSVPYSLYLLLSPRKFHRSAINRMLTFITFSILILVILFSFFAEFPFWTEFESRFNFIAVDYLVYTYEVINNINESYPLPYLIGAMLAATGIVVYLFYRWNIFKFSFQSETSFKQRFFFSGTLLLLSFVHIYFLNNDWAESSSNRYYNELSKAGIYSFFSAFKNNELDYGQFYPQIDQPKAFQIVRTSLRENGTGFSRDSFSIRRRIHNSKVTAGKPNVIMVTLESFSADFMECFGNRNHLTPVLDSLAENSIFFTNMYATGTRTVRGMEALSLGIPPTPGHSIVRRRDNDSLQTVGYIFRRAGYNPAFIYGGDGYFDNMNKFFGSNGYAIVDRVRNISIGEDYEASRKKIPDNKIHFENAWGICDEDLYDAVIEDADQKFNAGAPFYDFVMTTSNHRPFTYPAGKVTLPPGSGREGAVEYTDYAIGQFLKKIRTKPWYDNTVIIFVADHCASSAGKNEIEINKYHIPCLVVNTKRPAQKIDVLCSQIDLYPTLFAMMGWDYESNLFGKNVLSDDYIPRALLGTYQKLGYLKNDSLVILGPQRHIEGYQYNRSTGEQIPSKMNENLVSEAIAYYQTAYYLYKHRGLHQ